MYESYFHFREKPFELLPDPDFLYLSKSHRKAITYLRYGVQERSGFMLLTGEVGAGKTTLIRHFMKSLGDTIPLCKIFNTKVNGEQLLAMINEDFGIESSSRDKVQLVKDLNAFLISEYGNGRRPLLIIDEAQNLSIDLLEEVRMLSNLETDNTKLIQILLVGQPELGKMLSAANLRQLRQRISIVCHLQTLSQEEMTDYIFHRLTVAGNRDAVTFTDQALDSIFEYSAGIPRLINVIGNLLLLTAYTEGANQVDGKMVNEIVESLEPRSYYVADDAESERKKALLRALGISSKMSQNTSPAAAIHAVKPPLDADSALVKICDHLDRMEKKYLAAQTAGFATMIKRMNRLELLLGEDRKKAKNGNGNAPCRFAENDKRNTPAFMLHDQTSLAHENPTRDSREKLDG